jgi:hypothetical protein
MRTDEDSCHLHHHYCHHSRPHLRVPTTTAKAWYLLNFFKDQVNKGARDEVNGKPAPLSSIGEG